MRAAQWRQPQAALAILVVFVVAAIIFTMRAMSTILTLVLVTIFIIAADFAYYLFQQTRVYQLLRDSLWRLSEKLMRFLFV